MKNVCLLMAILLMCATCISAQETENEFYDEENEFLNAYVIVIDTSENYFELQTLMYEVSKKLNFEIDTMERGYDIRKDLICLPDDHEDEIYAGDYFPRRYPSENLSIEYFIIYESSTNNKMMALVAGIFEDENVARQVLNTINKKFSKSFIVNSDLYIGTMH